MRDVLISLQQPGNAHDCARKLPGVVFADAFHARLPNRFILKINERETLPAGIHHNVRLVVFLNPPRRWVSAPRSHTPKRT